MTSLDEFYALLRSHEIKVNFRYLFFWYHKQDKSLSRTFIQVAHYVSRNHKDLSLEERIKHLLQLLMLIDIEPGVIKQKTE